METNQAGLEGNQAVLAPCHSVWQERHQVKISATSALGYMLRHIYKFKPGLSTRREIYSFLVPLLLSFQDNNPEVVKVLMTSVPQISLIHFSFW